MFKFLARQSFIVNFISAIVFVFVLGFIFFESLGWITNHGSYLKVPSVSGLNVDKAVSQLEKDGFEVIITDSSYNDSVPLNIVRKQLPEAGATVKVNRTVFLNVNPQELPLIDMPKLEGLSYRFALDKLDKSHLVLKDTTVTPNFMKGSVLSQSYNGVEIKPGTKVRWGSAISLEIGGGNTDIQIKVPNLVGLTVSEAREVLKNNSIVLASILTSGEITDTANAFVFRQNPDVAGSDNTPFYIQPGQTMDIWIQRDRPVIDSTQANIPPPTAPVITQQKPATITQQEPSKKPTDKK
ncbi:MAG: PASTA domain-containing protein [Ginsengibacter sp.]